MKRIIVLELRRTNKVDLSLLGGKSEVFVSFFIKEKNMAKGSYYKSLQTYAWMKIVDTTNYHHNMLWEIGLRVGEGRDTGNQ